MSSPVREPRENLSALLSNVQPLFLTMSPLRAASGRLYGWGLWRSCRTCDSSLGSLESCSTDLGTPSTVGTSLVSQSPQAAAARRRRRMRRMSQTTSSASVTCDRESEDSATAAAANDSTLQPDGLPAHLDAASVAVGNGDATKRSEQTAVTLTNLISVL